jgi:tripartite-type tricarboxylate transporter receptor subunit TctC
MMHRKSLLGALLAAAVTCTVAPAAIAQGNFPNRPIRLIVPFAPGGGVDVVARIVGQKLSEKVGQPVLIETKPGAGGAIGVNELMRSDPDGYSILITTSSHATMPALNKFTWHPTNDFTPIANLYSSIFVMPTSSENASKFKTFQEFVSYAKANPGKVSWGSSGIGGPLHLAGMQFLKVAGIDAVHVPYRGNGPMTQALLSNEVQFAFDTPTTPGPHIESGKLIAMAVAGDKRLDRFPKVPTVRESGVDFSIEVSVFAIGPKGIPEPILARLNKEFVAVLAEKDVRDRLTAIGLLVAEGSQNTPANLKKHLDDFAATYGKLITELNIKAE